MTEVLLREWKPLLLCFLLAVLVWFLLNDPGGQSPAPALLAPASALTPTLESP